MAIIIGTAAGDTLGGTGSADEIYGLDGEDLLDGGEGDDLLDGGVGSDQLTGGTGDDVYIVDEWGDAAIEAADEGVDEIRTTVSSYVLPADFENLTGLSAAVQVLEGNGLDNVITGGDGWNSINAGGGDDTIVHSDGGGSVDGGSGQDTYVLPGSAADYEITRSFAVVIRDLVGSQPDVYLYNVEAIRFETGDVTVTVASLFDRFGTEDSDTLTGNDSDNYIYGYGGDDILLGYGGADHLDGGAGADTLEGGDGGDRYVVDEAGDAIVEAAGAGYDVVWSWSSSYAMGANVEELVSLYEGDVDIAGNNGANLILTDWGDDWIEGWGGHDEIDGGSGDDTMIGGAGNDLYRVYDQGDVVVEAAGSGIDTVDDALESYVLPANVENVLLAWEIEQALTGNGLANIVTMAPGAKTVNGGAGTDTVIYEAEEEAVIVDLATGENEGGAADDLLTSIENVTGSWHDDELRGTSGANLLNGGFGADVLVGRGGNDVYCIDGDDLVVEEEGEGSDEIRTTAGDFALPDHVEKLKHVGSLDFIGTGNDLNNDMTSGAGADALDGGEGHDSLSAGAGDDSLFGGAGQDVLSGGSGADHMEGGAGDDVYLVDQGSDEVVELADEGVDHVYASSAAYTLPDEVENLSYNAYGAFHGTGNALANVIYGGSGADTLEGLAGDDELRGGSGPDALEGGDGADLLIGGAGADELEGGAGADTFRIGAYESGTAAAADRILDFIPGEDLIDLSSIDADLGTAGDQAFAFIGAGAFSGAAGELRHSFDGTDTRLEADVDGDAAADFEIVLAGPATLLAGDFVP